MGKTTKHFATFLLTDRGQNEYYDFGRQGGIKLHHFRGRVNRVTNIAKFLATIDDPDPSSFRPIPDAVVIVNLRLKDPAAEFFVEPSFADMTSNDGSFDVKIPQDLGLVASMVADANVSVSKGIISLPLAPMPRFIYRSAAFPLDKLDSNFSIFTFRATLEDEKGITQQQVDREADQARSKVGASTMLASIFDGGVNISLERDGTSIKFDVVLRPSISSNLERLLEGSILNLDVDRPGPDFISEICISDNDILRKFIQPGIDRIMSDVNKQVLDAIISDIAALLDKPKSVVEDVFNTRATMTFEKLDFPVVRVTKIGPFSSRERVIEPVPAIGFPRHVR